jgi:archaeal flagellar protein FlaJ
MPHQTMTALGETIYAFVSRITPRALREKYQRLLIYADIKIHPDIYLGFWVFFGFLSSLGISFLISFVLDRPGIFIWLFVGIFIGSQVLVYALLNLVVDSRSTFVELVLPDVLQLMASNLRAGMTIDRALLLAARPEFGNFQKELVQVGKEMATGREIEVALLNLTERIRSDVLKKTVILLISGLRSGGQLAPLLEQTAKNLRSQQFMRERVKSSVGTYVLFVISAIGFGAPFLFGLSTVLVTVLTQILSSVDLSGTEGTNIPITFSTVAISKGFIVMYAMIFIGADCFFGSMFIGLINRGKAREGLRYFLGLLVLAYAIYWTVYLGVSSIFLGLGILPKAQVLLMLFT